MCVWQLCEGLTLLDADGFHSPAFGGQMVCGEVTVAWVCACVCVRIRAADEQGDLMPVTQI